MNIWIFGPLVQKLYDQMNGKNGVFENWHILDQNSEKFSGITKNIPEHTKTFRLKFSRKLRWNFLSGILQHTKKRNYYLFHLNFNNNLNFSIF